MNRGCLCLAGALAILLAFAGCGSNLPEGRTLTTVSGTVSIDGKPVADGEISFTKASEGVNESLPIKDGRFAGKASVGERKVEIRAYREEKIRVTGSYVPPGGATTTRTNYLPAKYNTTSTLKATLEADKENALPAFVVTEK